MKQIVASELLGNVGRWHYEKTFFFSLLMIPLAWHYLSYPLLSAPKAFTCTASPSDQCFINNDTQHPCSEWTFEDNGVLPIQEDFGLVCHNERLLSFRQTIFFLGMLVGCTITGSFSDRYGRKPTMLVLMGLWSTSSLLHALAPNYTIFLVLQFVLALSAQSAWTVGWIWLMEIFGCNDRKRVIFGLATLISWAVGYVSTPGIVYLLPNWRIAFGAMSLPTLLFVLYIWILPESPTWLIHKGRIEEAAAILEQVSLKNNLPILDVTFLRKTEEAIGSAHASTENLGQEHNCSSVFWSLFATPRLLMRTIILSFCFFVGSLLYYGLSLNSNSVGGNDNLFLTFTLYGLMEVPAVAFAIVSLLALGRRLPTVLLYLFTGLACLGAAVIPDNTLKICVAVFGKLCITACFHTLFVYASEMYATSHRNTGLSLCSIFARVAGMTGVYVGELHVIHPFLPISVFGFCGVAAALLATVLPETKGKEMPKSVAEAEEFGKGDTLWSQLFRCCFNAKEQS